MLNIQYVNGLDTDASPGVYFQNYTLLNAKISYRIWEPVELFLSGENILNQEYVNIKYYTLPGITAFGGLNFRI
jgi:iron complex outermembrane receptor protein